jgi:hypothetical protein
MVSNDILEALRMLKEWSTGLLTIQTAVIAAIELIPKGPDLCTGQFFIA